MGPGPPGGGVLPEVRPRARRLWGARGCGWDVERDAAVVRVGPGWGRAELRALGPEVHVSGVKCPLWGAGSGGCSPPPFLKCSCVGGTLDVSRDHYRGDWFSK